MTTSRIREHLKHAAESCLRGELLDKVTYECDLEDDSWPKRLQPNQLCDAIERLLSHANECVGGPKKIKIRIEQISKNNDAASPFARGYLMLYAEGCGMTILMAY